MSALVFVRDGRTLPYVPVTIASQQAIRKHVPKRRPYAVATYVALLEFANDDRTDRVAVTQRDIVQRVGAGRTTVQAALTDLQAAGVLRVIERTHGASRIENEYVIVEPSEERDESDTPARDTGDPRPPHGQLTKEGEETKEGSARASKTDVVPDDFPDKLRPHAREVMRVLRSVAADRGSRRVTTRAVALTIAARPHKPLVRAAHDCAAWIADHPEVPCIDVVSRYRRWLDREPDLEAIERLADDGTPTGAVRQHPPGVTPIHAAGRYDARAAKAQREAEREAAAMRVLSLQQEGIT